MCVPSLRITWRQKRELRGLSICYSNGEIARLYWDQNACNLHQTEPRGQNHSHTIYSHKVPTHTHKHSKRATKCNGLVEKHYKTEAECGDSDLTVTASIPELGFHIFTLSPWRLMLVLPENGLIIWPAWLTLVFFFFFVPQRIKIAIKLLTWPFIRRPVYAISRRHRLLVRPILLFLSLHVFA